METNKKKLLYQKDLKRNHYYSCKKENNPGLDREVIYFKVSRSNNRNRTKHSPFIIPSKKQINTIDICCTLNNLMFEYMIELEIKWFNRCIKSNIYVDINNFDEDRFFNTNIEYGYLYDILNNTIKITKVYD